MKERKGRAVTLFLCALLCLFLAPLLSSCLDLGAPSTATEPPRDTTPVVLPAPEEIGPQVTVPAYTGEKQLSRLTLSDADKQRNAQLTVVIDAGHGQKDAGVIAMLDGRDVEEKTVNLALALRLEVLLKEMGFKVETVRRDDRALLGAAGEDYDTDDEAEARRLWAESLPADIYISLHCNSAGTDAEGSRIFFNGRVGVSFAGRAVAERFRASLNLMYAEEIAGGEMPAVESYHLNPQQNPYIVLKSKDMPAFLFEVGFMTNDAELRRLTDGNYLWEYAGALADAVCTANREGLLD